ncbi:ATP-binding protein [Xylophilus sp. GOD-11R]|uniref:ATP-binding protein n=1 Tax=Xylophilus sp. GOD-11R TaxID=3089814 RepID=UPI00298CB971|nr:ATP-binding protein [Xylophilus sp. GOD-11R]WPB56097.1 ATP-binding protein [Xylophilus sp. GOD-11R]
MKRLAAPALRWLRSTAGQLVMLLLAGLLIVNIVAVITLNATAERLNPVSRDQVLERLAIAYRAMQLSDADDEPAMLSAISSEGARFWTEHDTPPAHGPLSAEERQVLTLLGARLPGVAPERIWVMLEDPRGRLLGSFDTRLGWSILRLSTAVRLHDGRWLHSEQQPLAGYQWWRLLRFSLPTSTLPVLCIVLIFVWRTLRPIKAIAQAAERVSRGERIEPLPIVGPSEAREVSAAFNLMQDKLTRYIDDRTQLLAAISHDFRTPITSLRLRAEFIDDEQQRTAMIRTLDQMRVMVEQTLRFTQDDAPHEGTRTLDLQALLHEVVAEHRTLGQDTRLEPAPPTAYRARPVSLKRAVGNLVDNAVRHGRFARVRLVEGDGAAGGRLRIEVDDGGPGLAPEWREKVFEPFFQLDRARTRQDGDGVGLGLSIARSCVRAHGGELTLANLQGGGLRATIVLP